MQTIAELSQFDATVPYVEITDPVLGGTGGESNAAVIALANRTRYLLNAAGGFTGVSQLTAGANLTTAYLTKLVYINVTNNEAFTLDALSNFLVGQCITVKVKCPQGKCVSFTPNGSEQLTSGQTTKTIEWLCDGEQITFVKRNSTQWEMINAIGNFNNVGNDALVRIIPKNAAVAKGDTANRADYARLWAAVESTAIPQSTWASDDLDYRGFFGDGDGATTFCFPDMRAMHLRALDLGRGVDLTRITGTAGGYGADENKAHTHIVTTGLVQHTATAATVGVTDGPPGGAGTKLYTTSSNGDTEVTVKTIGLTPVIFY